MGRRWSQVIDKLRGLMEEFNSSGQQIPDMWSQFGPSVGDDGGVQGKGWQWCGMWVKHSDKESRELKSRNPYGQLVLGWFSEAWAVVQGKGSGLKRTREVARMGT